MDKTVIRVEVKAVLPTSGGCAVFLGNDEKIFVIYIDHSVGAAITMAMRQVPRERPQSHDLMASMLLAFGGRVDRVVINDFNSGVFYARLILLAENELFERKVVEIDARPSDCIALASIVNAPLYVTRHLFGEMEDMTEMLRRMEEKGATNPGDEDSIPF